MKEKIKLTGTAVLTAALLFAGCGRYSKDSKAAQEDMYLTVETQAAADLSLREAAYTNGFYAAGASSASADDFDYEYDEEYAAGEAVRYEDGVSSVGVISESDDVLSERMLIRYVSLSCETLHFNELVSDIEASVQALGGYIENKNSYGTGNDGDLRSASYTIRISSDALDALINTIGSAAIITGTSENTEDVTLSYADTSARIESLRIEQETLNELLAEADSLDAVIILQNELTNIRYQIESYESQLRTLRNLSSYSTLTLSIREVLEERAPEEPHIKTYSEKVSDSFHDGLDNTKEFFQDLWINIVGNIIPIVVTIVLIAAAIIVIVKVIRKIKRKMKKAATLKSASAAAVGDPRKAAGNDAKSDPSQREDGKPV